MPNSFFKFKQFIIHQDQCAMKVCTDACLFGAIIANNKNKFNTALDIGTGTGLLSLMFAQKHLESTIDAIEIEEQTYYKAKSNIEQSDFSKNIQVHLTDIKYFLTEKQYDIIFSNPPFYTNDLKSPNDVKNIAHHSSLLSFEDLIKSVKNLLKTDGIFYVLLPFKVEYDFVALSISKGFFIEKIINIKQTPHHKYFRSIISFTRTNKEVEVEEIIIKLNETAYSIEFKNLLNDYYLNL